MKTKTKKEILIAEKKAKLIYALDSQARVIVGPKAMKRQLKGYSRNDIIKNSNKKFQ